MATGTELPALSAQVTWPEQVDEALLLSSLRGPVVLGMSRVDLSWQLAQLSANASEPLAQISGDGPTWLSGCADEGRTAFAFGDDERLIVGARAVAGDVHLWSTQPTSLTHVIDRDDPQRDRVHTLCSAHGVLVVMREADDRLSALFCRDSEPSCRELMIAPEVDSFTALLTARGALFAYASQEQAQVRVRGLDFTSLKLSAERVPAGCWSKSGLCSRPVLARLGSRVVLAAPDKTDLLLLESADEGATWTAPPVL
jgi:hypothetical protein